MWLSHRSGQPACQACWQIPPIRVKPGCQTGWAKTYDELMSGAKRVVKQDLGTEWVAEMEWPDGVTYGGPMTLVIRPAQEGSYPAGGVSTTVLREVDLAAARDQLRTQRHGFLPALDHGLDQQIRAELANGLSERLLALVAARYVELVSQGQAKPLDVLAEITGRSNQTAKGWLWQARKRGLLTGSAGRAGGEVTAKARALLDG
jgi:hypothetical protein